MNPERSDDELLSLFVTKGDQAAFAEIVSRHSRMVFRVCRQVLHDQYEAEDASQEVFALLAQKAGGLKNTSRLAPWLFGVARNLSLQMLRKRTRPFETGEISEPLCTENDAAALQESALEWVYDAIAGLSEIQQQAVVLRYLKGYSEKESAELAGCAENTLAKRASNALAELRISASSTDAGRIHIGQKVRKQKGIKAMNTNTTTPVLTALGGLPGAGPSIRFHQIVGTSADPKRLYALGVSNSLYLSRDAGATWTIKPLPYRACSTIGVSPVNADHLLVGRSTLTDIVISQSLDGGANWSDVASHPIGRQELEWQICFSVQDPELVYIFLYAPKAFRLNLRTKKVSLLHDAYIKDILHEDPSKGHFTLLTEKSILSSTDDGQTWTAQELPKGLEYPMAVAVDPRNRSRVIVAFQHLYLSEDAGATWKDLGRVGKSYIDQLAFDPVQPNRFYAYDRLTGLTVTSNEGRTWNPVADSVLDSYARQIVAMYVSPATAGLVLLGTADGLYRSTDAGLTFAAAHDNLQRHSSVVGLSVDPSDSRHVVARSDARVYHSRDAGMTWSQAGGISACADWTHCSVALDASGRSCIVSNLAGAHFRSADGGLSFQQSKNGPEFWSIIADPRSPGRFLGSHPGVQVSDDGGMSWKAIKGVPNWVWTLAMSPADSKVVYASDYKTIYYLASDEKTGEAQFVPAATPPEGIVRQICAHPLDPKRAIAANLGGLWQTVDGGRTWALLCAGRFYYPYVRVSEPDSIYVSTDFGFGTWRDGQFSILEEAIRVNAYAEVSGGLLLGTETGIYKLTV